MKYLKRFYIQQSNVVNNVFIYFVFMFLPSFFISMFFGLKGTIEIKTGFAIDLIGIIPRFVSVFINRVTTLHHLLCSV